MIAPALVAWGGALMQAGRLDEAEQCLVRAERAVHVDQEPGLGFLLHLMRGGVQLARGRSAEAIASFRDAERLELTLVTDSPLRLQPRCSTLHAMLDRGEVAAVADALAELTEVERDAGALREVRARLALADGHANAVVAALAPTLSGSAEVHHVVVRVRSLLVEATARNVLGETHEAQAAVEQALELAEPDALILPFVHVASRELLERHPTHRTAHGAFLAEILDVLSGRALAPEHVPSAPLLDELSDAELRVLRFLPTNLPASAIAGEIYVSVNTVKTHTRHIYAKLDAHNRIEAVERPGSSVCWAARPAVAEAMLTRYVRRASTRGRVTVMA